jgi:hypothetical protein
MVWIPCLLSQRAKLDAAGCTWAVFTPVDGRTTMSSESVCQVARSWVDVGSFHTRFGREVYEFYSVSPEYFGYTLVQRWVEDRIALAQRVYSSFGTWWLLRRRLVFVFEWKGAVHSNRRGCQLTQPLEGKLWPASPFPMAGLPTPFHCLPLVPPSLRIYVPSRSEWAIHVMNFRFARKAHDVLSSYATSRHLTVRWRLWSAALSAPGLAPLRVRQLKLLAPALVPQTQDL